MSPSRPLLKGSGIWQPSHCKMIPPAPTQNIPRVKMCRSRGPSSSYAPQKASFCRSGFQTGGQSNRSSRLRRQETRSIGASPVVAFKATTHILDPGTQRTHTLTLSMGPGIDDGSANLFLQSDSIRNEGNWRADLYRGTELRASVPFADGYEELYRGLPAGIYTVKLTSAGDRAGQGHGIEGMGKVPGYRARPLEGAWRNFRRVTETARSVASVPSVPKSRKNS